MERFQDVPEPRDVASRLLERCGLGKLSELTRYTDEEYRKVYDTFHIVSTSGDHFALKLAEELPEVRVYRNVLSASDAVPRFLAARSVAEIHANHWRVCRSAVPWLGTYRQEFADEKLFLERYQPKPKDAHFDEIVRRAPLCPARVWKAPRRGRTVVDKRVGLLGEPSTLPY